MAGTIEFSKQASIFTQWVKREVWTDGIESDVPIEGGADG